MDVAEISIHYLRPSKQHHCPAYRPGVNVVSRPLLQFHYGFLFRRDTQTAASPRRPGNVLRCPVKKLLTRTSRAADRLTGNLIASADRSLFLFTARRTGKA